ncbi:TPA: lipase [Enterococcus faecium]|uniref:lipase n=1 Tax=Enterococcus sp. E4-112 TaxID=3002963 RepID=UPI00296B9ACF|nr:lipase [Enterococcus sp. E4-112]HAP8714335.1 lipase [Enterococcus faecium]MEB4741522.1 lipase [Enterococcus sp. E4-112]HAP8720064.1 lipase [Enterococcus faecium]HAP8722534.1 lipase [Enterococcus faecium]HAP8725735.1 lipase [Enterococcus faecium]
MTINDKHYNDISEKVYWLDPKYPRYNEGYKKNSVKEFAGMEFQILQIKDSLDGMQAMSVAPIKNGKVDLSQVVIAFAGTNLSDWKDLETDARSIMNLYGNRPGASFSEKATTNKILSVSGLKTAGQINSAIAFANEVKKEYGEAAISTTGHSLGGFLALYVAAEKQWKNVGFNGPDSYDLLSPEAKKWVEENPGMLTNYRNHADFIGNFGGNGTGAEVRISMETAFLNLLASHSLTSWKFDENGKLIIPENENNVKARKQQKENQATQLFSYQLQELNNIRKKLRLSGGQLTVNEQIYLDDTQARLVVEKLSAKMKSAMEEVIRINQRGIFELEKKWQEGLRQARVVAPSLTEQEIIEALASVGATKENLVDSAKEVYLLRINKARRMGEAFDTLAKEIQDKINEIVARDRELAQQFN